MKNRRGFTLVEMIFVIVVLCLVATASVSIFINIRKSILEKEYNNVVSYLETKAIEYANKTNITTINVEDLINQGLVKPDNQTDILCPYLLYYYFLLKSSTFIATKNILKQR